MGGAQPLGAADVYPFATFHVMVEIDIEDGEIDMTATFALGAGSNGFDPSKEAVALQVRGGTAAYSVTIPAGSFKSGKDGTFGFHGTITGVRLSALIRSLRGGTFEFSVETERAKLNGVANPVSVSLTLGDDGGSRSVRARIE
jgi:hypothetical protein